MIAADAEEREELTEQARLVGRLLQRDAIAVAEPGAPLGFGDRVHEPTEFVDEPALQRGVARPDVAARDGVDVAWLHVAPARDLIDEAVVEVAQLAEDERAFLVAVLAIERVHAGVGAALVALERDAELGRQAADVELAGEDADRSRERRRRGVDARAGGGDEVAARGGDVAERADDRLDLRRALE